MCQASHAKLSVLACEPEWAALVTEIGGEHITVFSATTAMQDPHQIQARPSLIARARRADMVVCSGAGLEAGWLPVLLRKSANPKIQRAKPGYFMATDYVELKGKVNNDPGNIHALGNPHVHLDPNRILIIAKALADTLMKIDMTNAGIYQGNADRFVKNWETAIRDWQVKASSLENTSVIVHHDSWIYLVQWLGLKQVATLEPRHGIPPSTSYLADLLELLKVQPADMILRSGYEDERPSQWLSDKTGIPIVSIPFSVNSYGNQGELKKWMDMVISSILQGKSK
jgi:zinc/manganese transport system substrate-binding protein